MLKKTPGKYFPLYGWIGIALIVVFWILNWSLSGLRTHWGFFPLWLGYCLTVDGLVYKRKGTSLLNRSFYKYLGMFIISVPTWWLFEFFNSFTNNWNYDGRQFFSPIQYFLLSSLSFSTVMPAVFGTAELVSTFSWVKKFQINFKLNVSKPVLIKLFVTGAIMMALIITVPHYFYYLIWFSLIFIFEPINFKLGNQTLLKYLSKGDWRPFISLSTGSLICGFFWELWNYYSYPKWIYNLPHLNFFHIFEMPVLGYIGYLPFSIEIFALYNIITGLLIPTSQNDNYLLV
jgi:hypothetical protein